MPLGRLKTHLRPSASTPYQCAVFYGEAGACLNKKRFYKTTYLPSTISNERIKKFDEYGRHLGWVVGVSSKYINYSVP